MTNSWRQAGGLATGLAAWTAAGGVLHACPICFRFEDSGATDGAVVAVIVLMSVTLAVLGGFGLFVARWHRRATSLSRGERFTNGADPR